MRKKTVGSAPIADRSRTGLAAAILFILLLPGLLGARTENELVASMDGRLPRIMELKMEGSVGENRGALLEARERLDREERRLVEAQNDDRMALYEKVADRLEVPVAKVRKSRAKQIRESSPEGVWLQDESGKWYQKKE